jgi:hypothetical protein
MLLLRFSDTDRTTFEFPLEVVLEYVGRLAERPEPFLAWLEAQRDSGAGVLAYPRSLDHLGGHGSVEDVVLSLIASARGVVFCPGCHQSIAADSLTTQPWGETGFSGGVAWGVGGREIVCRNGHQLLRVRDYDAMG